LDEGLPLHRAPELAGEKPVREFRDGFIDEHRQKIFLGLAIAGTLLLGPFTVNNFIQGRILLGVATSVFVICLLANATAIARGRERLIPDEALFGASFVGLGTAMYNNGLIGILWVYPGILLFHFMLPVRRANIFNALMIAMTVPFAVQHLGPAITTRVTVTQVLLMVFANLFSRIAESQHVKEAQQRERLDKLVRQLEEQNKALRDAFRVREEVERIARHDLKTPLASIASVPRLLRERHPRDAVETELLGTVERAALRVLSMVNLSLDLYRMEAGSYRLRAQAVDLAAVVNTVARELHPHARSKKVRLVVQLPPQPLYAQGEELLCYSIVANVLKNALEASPEGADVRIKLRLAPGHLGESVVLDIHNAGEVPQPVRARFFSKYATHGKKGGTGLGAYSARLMAQVQGGDLFMTSRQDTTTLSLRLPPWRAALPGHAAQGQAPAPAAQSAEALPALSVLLVDDDEYNIVVLKNLLPTPPLSVQTAVNGRAALELVREARPDVIFMDLEMPIMGGIEAARRIRELQRERGEVPSFIAAFSAHDDERTQRKSLQAGFDLYLSKPASREEVLAVLRREDPAAAHPGRPAQATTVTLQAEDTVPPPTLDPAAEEAADEGAPPTYDPAAEDAADDAATVEVFAAVTDEAVVVVAPPAAPASVRVLVEPGLMPLMPEFLSSRREMAQALVCAVQQGERETLRVTAHKLAGSLAMYGFKDASRASLEVEKAAPEGDLGELRARCDALVEMIALVEPVARPA
jgi:signal transduction histidine kinase/CheY-like chemotaxis protein